jgi:3-hydroxyisobutyrate dehydrogenase-like beta-hydroxyacid dehydrogenase
VTERSAVASGRDIVVGVVGIGIIGGGIARALERGGWRLALCDHKASATAPFAPGATICDSPAEVARRSDVVIIAVFSEAQVREVVAAANGLLRGARRGLVVVTVSTIGVPLLEELARVAEDAGVTLLDCGVTGGRESAAQGRLICMIGGAAADVERVRPVLESFSTLVVRVGPPGAGIRAKLAKQVITYASYYATHRASELASRAGVDLEQLARAVRAADEQSGGPATQQLARHHAPLETRAHQAAACHKDLEAAKELAARVGMDLEIAELVLAHVDETFTLGERR